MVQVIQKHSNTELSIDESVSFGTIRSEQVFSNFDIHCGDLQGNKIHGPAILQIQRSIKDEIDAATLTTQSALNLNAPLASPTFTGTVSVNGTLACPQVAPHPSQNNFNSTKTPGLYHYDGGLSNAPTGSLNYRSREIGYGGSYSQITMP